MIAVGGDRHADVASLAGVLPFSDVGPVQVDVSQALYLEKIHGAAAEQPLGLAPLIDAVLLAVDVDLGREKEPVPKLGRMYSVTPGGLVVIEYMRPAPPVATTTAGAT